MKYQKILITGGAGFIGSHTTDYFIEKGYSVRILDSLDPQVHTGGKPPAYLNPAAEFIKGDVTNRSDLQKALVGIDAVIHFAAAVGVGQSMYQIERYVHTNSLGTAILLDILANEPHTVKKIIVAASMSSFGEGIYRCPKCQKFEQPGLRDAASLAKGIWEPLCTSCQTSLIAVATDETAKLQSPSIYAITKKNQEELCLSFAHAYQIPAVSLRFFNAFGPRQSLSNPYVGVAAIFFSRVKNNQPPLMNEDGLQSRDFIYVTDIVRAVTLSLEKDEANYQTFNVGSGIPISVQQVAEVVLRLTGSNLKPQLTGKFRNFDIRHCFADTSKLQNLLGWKPQFTFEQGMKKIHEWSQKEAATDHVDRAMQELTKRGLL